MDTKPRPAWLLPGFIMLTVRGGMPLFIRADRVASVTEYGEGGGSAVMLLGDPGPFVVQESPQGVFAAITQATA